MNNPAPSGLRMRVVFPVILIAAGLLAVIVVTAHMAHTPIHGSHPTTAEASTLPAVSAADSVEPVPNLARPISTISPQRNIAPVAAANRTTNAIASNALAALPAQTDFSPAQKVSELDDLMIGDRPEQEKLGVMLATVGRSNKTVRAAALEHIKELDDRDALPQLQSLADQTDDTQDKAALQDVIDYLNLPSLADHSADGRKAPPLVPKNSTARERRQTHVPPNPPKPAAADGK